jgi:hypothetical protein
MMMKSALPIGEIPDLTTGEGAGETAGHAGGRISVCDCSLSLFTMTDSMLK